MKSNLRQGILVFALLVTAALPAFARTNEAAVSIEKYSVRKGETSEDNRADKRYYLSAQPVGFAVVPVPSLGVNAGYFLNRDLILQLEYSSGRLPYVFFDIDAKTLAFNAKYFFGNSFYLKGGASYRQIALQNVRCLVCSTPDRVLLEDVGSADSLAAEFAIGNQWQWQTFTLGCDWIGVMQPLATMRIRDNIGDVTKLSGSQRTELRNSWETLAKVHTFEFLRFYLGASF